MGVEKGGRAEQEDFFVLSSPLGYSPFAGPSDASGPGLCSSKPELSSLRPLGVSADMPSSFWPPGFYPALPTIHNNFL